MDGWQPFHRLMVIPRREVLRLRKMGNRYIIVSTDADSVNMADVFTLNESAALLWERAASAESFDENICEVLVENYGIDRETALRDTLSTLSQWKEYGLVTE